MTAVTIRSAGSNWPFDIKFDRGADLCWSINLPGWWRGLDGLLKHNDTTETLADGSVLVYSGSLERLMGIVGAHVCETEF